MMITLWNHTEDGYNYWFDVLGLLAGVTTEISANCIFPLIRCGDSVVLVTLTAPLWSNIVDIEWEISRLAVSLNIYNGVRVPVVFHSERWSAKARIVLMCLVVLSEYRQ